jgi:hypothetical protein
MSGPHQKRVLIFVAMAFLLFGVAHDFEIGTHDSSLAAATVGHEEPTPHAEAVCSFVAGLLIVGIGLAAPRDGSVSRSQPTRLRPTLLGASHGHSRPMRSGVADFCPLLA